MIKGKNSMIIILISGIIMIMVSRNADHILSNLNWILLYSFN